MLLHQKLGDARKKKGMTQEELAERAGITVRTVQRMESGETVPRAFTLKAIAAALDIPFEELAAPAFAAPAESEPPVPLPASAAATGDPQDEVHFLQLLCLSCFSFLVLPIIHLLLPYSLLRKKTGLSPNARAYAREVLRTQLYWIVALNLALLGTLAYNLFCSVYLDPSYYLNYLVPFFIGYGVNAFLLFRALRGIRKMERPTEHLS